MPPVRCAFPGSGKRWGLGDLASLLVAFLSCLCLRNEWRRGGELATLFPRLLSALLASEVGSGAEGGLARGCAASRVPLFLAVSGF